MPGKKKKKKKKLIQTANIWLSCTKYVISAGLLYWISLVYIGGVSKLQNISKCGKK